MRFLAAVLTGVLLGVGAVAALVHDNSAAEPAPVRALFQHLAPYKAPPPPSPAPPPSPSAAPGSSPAPDGPAPPSPDALPPIPLPSVLPSLPIPTLLPWPGDPGA